MPVDGLIYAFLATLLLVPILRLAALRLDRFSNTIPPVGGLAFLVAGLIALLLTRGVLPGPLTFALLTVCAIGILDDLTALSPRAKTVLLLAALGLSVGLTDTSPWLAGPIIDRVLHVLWLLWMCNAFNVFDSVDGLSGGVGVLMLTTLGAVATLVGLDSHSLVCLLLAASLIAYLFYNFPPARVYMGDSGSLLIGFVLGETVWQVASTTASFGGAVGALLIVSVICFEGVFLILIRIAKVTMPSVSTYDHPTQRLIHSGCSVKGAVVRMYVLTATLCAGGVVCLRGDGAALVVVVGAVLGLVVTGVMLARVDTAGDGVDARPGSVFSKNWLVNRIVHQRMLSIAGRARGVLVDLGCGHRPYEAIFGGHVNRYIGIDLDLSRYDAGAIDVLSSSEVVPLASESVDTVLSNQVLEHLREPGVAVSEMARILKPGGVAIITAPHIWGVHEEPHDYFRFTPYGLRHLAEKAGLRVESVDALAGYWVTAGARFCYYLERFDRGPFQLVVAVANYLIQATAFVLDRVHRVEGDAWNHVMIAIKGPENGTSTDASNN